MLGYDKIRTGRAGRAHVSRAAVAMGTAPLAPTFVTPTPAAASASSMGASSSSSFAAAAAATPALLPPSFSFNLPGMSPAGGGAGDPAAAAASSSSAVTAQTDGATSSSAGSLEFAPSARRLPYSLLGSKDLPKSLEVLRTQIYLVLYGGSITTSILRSEVAGHVGLLIGGRFADFERTTVAPSPTAVDGYYPRYGTARYYKLNVICNEMRWSRIVRLSKAFNAYNLAHPGTHSAWPYHCRSFVSAVLFHILKLNPRGLRNELAGLGDECQSAARMAVLEGHVCNLSVAARLS